MHADMSHSWFWSTTFLFETISKSAIKWLSFVIGPRLSSLSQEQIKPFEEGHHLEAE